MPLPHALESLLSILVAIQQDNASSGAGPSCSLSLRQSYATALIRLVNGLVDPLQAGTYARSILSIAAQIGLPAWLVELRHAATHEDLPSLELLRDGAKEVSVPRLPPSPPLLIPLNFLSLHVSRLVSRLAPAKLLSPDAEPGLGTRAILVLILVLLVRIYDPSRGAAAETVQEPAEDGVARRIAARAARGGHIGCASRDRTLACRGARRGAHARERVCFVVALLSRTPSCGGGG